MSNENRQPPGTPVGGQFAEGRKASPDASVALGDDHTPIELADGHDETIDGDGDVVEDYNVQRTGEEYFVSATVPGGTASYLLDAEDVDDEAFAELMTGGRWRAMTDFLENRYEGAVVSDRAEGDELVFDVGGESFDHAPAPVEVVDAAWPMAATIHNETDAGTFGSEFVGRLLQEHLDKKAFVEPYPMFSGDRWYPDGPPMELGDALTEVDQCFKSRTTISDRAVQTLAHEFSREHQAYVDLAGQGYADREQLSNAVEEVGLGGAHVANAIARWADAQPTTRDLFDAAPKKEQP